MTTKKLTIYESLTEFGNEYYKNRRKQFLRGVEDPLELFEEVKFRPEKARGKE